MGPLPFADLKEKAHANELDPRLDMVWTQGMTDWKPAGEIEGLFEKRSSAATQESLAPSADPYAPPQQNGAAGMLGPDGAWPGARRRSFYLMAYLFPIIWQIGFLMVTPLLQQQFGAETTNMAIMGTFVVLVVVILVFCLKRLVNLGMSRWWFFGMFVPILNLWVNYRMHVCPAGYAFHKKLDGIGIALAILYWLMIIAAIVMVGVMIAVITGAIGDPELQQQLQEIIRQAPEP